MANAEVSADARSAAPGLRPLHGAARVFAVTAFPVAVVVTHAAAVALMRTGVAPALAIGPAIVACYAFLAVSERLLPWHASWLGSKGDLRTDIGLFATNGVVGAAATPAVLVGSAALGAWLAAQVGTGLWPFGWPLVAQLALGLVIAELVEYSFHRAMHEVPWLWRFHATHHSSPRLYWLNAARFHPVDLFLVGTLKLAPLSVLGAGAEILALSSSSRAYTAPSSTPTSRCVSARSTGSSA